MRFPLFTLYLYLLEDDKAPPQGHELRTVWLFSSPLEGAELLILRFVCFVLRRVCA